MGKLVQYIIVRSDLLKELKWPVGAVIAQTCHASCAVMHMFTKDGNVQEYLQDLDNMHKVVLEVQCHEEKAYHCLSVEEKSVEDYNTFENILTTNFLSNFKCYKVSDEPSLQQLEQTLRENGVDHKLWIEQPENIPTCLALKPYLKEEVHQYLKKLKLYKG